MDRERLEMVSVGAMLLQTPKHFWSVTNAMRGRVRCAETVDDA